MDGSRIFHQENNDANADGERRRVHHRFLRGQLSATRGFGFLRRDDHGHHKRHGRRLDHRSHAVHRGEGMRGRRAPSRHRRGHGGGGHSCGGQQQTTYSERQQKPPPDPPAPHPPPPP